MHNHLRQFVGNIIRPWQSSSVYRRNRKVRIGEFKVDQIFLKKTLWMLEFPENLISLVILSLPKTNVSLMWNGGKLKRIEAIILSSLLSSPLIVMLTVCVLLAITLLLCQCTYYHPSRLPPPICACRRSYHHVYHRCALLLPSCHRYYYCFMTKTSHHHIVIK